MENDDPLCPSPSLYPRPPSSLLLKDISNFKTPKRPSKPLHFQSPSPHFFTASKQTPKSSYSVQRRRLSSVRSKSKTAAARRLKSLELEQSQSAYKSQLKKEQSLRSLSKSLTVWLNFLFENPKLCGCDKFGLDETETKAEKGKRDGGEMMWRSPKRQRDIWWKGNDEVEDDRDFTECKNLSLRDSFRHVCSFDDLKQRMREYLSLGCCKDVLDIMARVTKNIDEGRLKMKSHCPIVTDVGMREKAAKILMSYNPVWLRIGLYIIFGGDSLLSSEDAGFDQEMTFLKIIIEKQFFVHLALAKSYAYNKKVEGLYRPGYYETLGNIILKRFLLLVLILDRAKSKNLLHLKYGIDGIDGGSPPLFTAQSTVRSSRQMIVDFLSPDIMHGEGNLHTHLLIVGYKVSYQQCPLVDYDFRVSNLFMDIQDGVLLCRVVQLLLQDSSILMKMVVPSDARKKNLMNCAVGLQYLRQAGVMLCDEDGTEITEDDVVNGDKELILSLLWNIFVQLQVPLLIKKYNFVEEICKICGTSVDNFNSKYTPLGLLLKWIQVICEKYDCVVEGFPSMIDGKAIWCLLDFYFRKELCCSSKYSHETPTEESIMSTTNYADAFHNFILSQKLTSLLGNFPQVLEMSDILEHNGACSERSVVILLVFLSSQLIVRKSKDQLNFHKLLDCKCQSPERRCSNIVRCLVNPEAYSDQDEKGSHSAEDAARKFKALQSWWQQLAERSSKSPSNASSQSILTTKKSIDIEREIPAAKVIQSNYRRWIERRHFLKIRNAVSFLQIVVRAWLAVKHTSVLNFNISTERWKESAEIQRYVNFIVERHGFLKLKRSVLLVQQAARIWIIRRHQAGNVSACESIPYLQNGVTDPESVHNVIGTEKVIPFCQERLQSDLKMEAACKIQFAWRNFISIRCSAATKIQSHVRGRLIRKRYIYQREAAMKIQSDFRYLRSWRKFQQHKVAVRSAIVIQSCLRGWIARRAAQRQRHLVVIIQSHYRGWLMRRHFLLQREAVIRIQSAIRCLNCQTSFQSWKFAATEVQRFVRGHITRTRLLGASSYYAAIPYGSNSNNGFHSSELEVVLSSVLKIQRWWKHVLLLKLKTKSATIIQSYIRGWSARQKASREKHSLIVIQSCWKGYLARKGSSRQLHDLRVNIKKSASNVDDGMRIINRLLRALSELLNMKTTSGILHTCAILDMATGHSKKCCETLVSAGAINTLLKLIRSVTRSIPDQEILKHAISTLRNLARYPHLTEVLIESPGCVEIIFVELLRNKDEGYFITSEILRKICRNPKGLQVIRKLPAYIKRLNNLVDELSRKVNLEKRNPRNVAVRENMERKLKDSSELLKLITNVKLS